MARPTDTGMNRTGIAVSPVHGKDILQIVERQSRGAEQESPGVEKIERTYIEDAETLGSVPPPTSAKGMATSALEMLKGNKPAVFLDKLGERLAFERSGVRLYDAVLTKFDTLGSWEGGPSRDELAHIRDEELSHFRLVHESIERLGADPTAMTPSADLAGVESSGVLQVIADPRTTMPEALHALLVAERADTDGWLLLIELADGAGQTELADQYRECHQREEQHATDVQTWLTNAVRADMGRELNAGQEQQPPAAH